MWGNFQGVYQHHCHVIGAYTNFSDYLGLRDAA